MVLSLLSVLCFCEQIRRLVMWNAGTSPAPSFGCFLALIRVCCPSVSLSHRWRLRIRSSILSLPVFETRSRPCVWSMHVIDVCYGCVSHCVSASDIKWWHASDAVWHTCMWHTCMWHTSMHLCRTAWALQTATQASSRNQYGQDILRHRHVDKHTDNICSDLNKSKDIRTMYS